MRVKSVWCKYPYSTVYIRSYVINGVWLHLTAKGSQSCKGGGKRCVCVCHSARESEREIREREKTDFEVRLHCSFYRVVHKCATVWSCQKEQSSTLALIKVSIETTVRWKIFVHSCTIIHCFRQWVKILPRFFMFVFANKMAKEIYLKRG